jgi:hypothetical protein
LSEIESSVSEDATQEFVEVVSAGDGNLVATDETPEIEATGEVNELCSGTEDLDQSITSCTGGAQGISIPVCALDKTRVGNAFKPNL